MLWGILNNHLLRGEERLLIYLFIILNELITVLFS